MIHQIVVNQHEWHIFLNRNAMHCRSSEYWKSIEAQLTSAQVPYCCHYAQSQKEDTEVILNCCRNGVRHFVVVGGDGSLNFFIDNVVKSGINISDIFVAVIPLGTGNDWARSHHYPTKPQEAVTLFLNGKFISHDVGKVVTKSAEGESIRHFINIAGFGFDAEVIQRTKVQGNKTSSSMYLLSLLKTLFNYKSKKVSVLIDGKLYDYELFTAAVGINQYNGNGMRQCPDAICNDGFFQTVIIRKVGILKVLRNVGRLFKGTHVKLLKEVESFQSQEVQFISTKDLLLGEVEGEMLSKGDYSVTLLPKRINLLTGIE